MRSYHADLGCGIDGLSVREHDTPQPGPGQALVRVRASSLNHRELMILRGRYPLPIKDDVVPVSDGAGPDYLSYEQAATLPCAGVTAWHALTGGRGLRAGETVLTLGSGGVSLFAVQFAKAFGARVIATAGSGEKAERLRALGADEAIDYRATPNWHELVRELTGGGVDHVVEVTRRLEQSVRATAMNGEIAFVGLLSEGGNGVPSLDPSLLWLSGADVRSRSVPAPISRR